MNALRFEWDPRKAQANLIKHGVSFEEARSVFFDEKAVEFYDDEHAEWEDRFLLLGITVCRTLANFAEKSYILVGRSC